MLDFFFENNLLICVFFFLLAASFLIIHFSLARRAKIVSQIDLKVEFETAHETELLTNPVIEKAQIEQFEVIDHSLDLCIEEPRHDNLIETDNDSIKETILDSNLTQEASELSFESKRLNAIELFFEKDPQPTEKNCDLDFFNKLNSYYKQSA